MRLDHLSIRNFKALREVDVDFEPATVIVGANDSGKSSLLDAIHWIFSTADRSGRPYSADRYLRRDYLGIPLDKSDPRRTVAVRATFSDLSAHESAVWAPVLEDGTITFGRRIDDDFLWSEGNDGAEQGAGIERARWPLWPRTRNPTATPRTWRARGPRARRGSPTDRLGCCDEWLRVCFSAPEQRPARDVVHQSA